jgi:hypothetical protein
MKRVLLLVLGAFLVLTSACSEATGTGPDTGAGATGGDGGGVHLGDEGRPLSVSVPADGRAFVALGKPEVVDVEDGSASTAWDLAFGGEDVFTNGGASGPGSGGAFGPLAAAAFLSDTMPEFPFVILDETGGALLGWYFYDGDAHVLWSRHHVYGVRDGDRAWKVQISSYYGEIDGAPVSGLYRLRYAEVFPEGVGPTVELVDVDGTAGGSSAPPDAPSACLDLDAGVATAMTPDEARASDAWHLCFRREVVSVNGELGGPRGVGAVDLDADETPEETLEEVRERTDETELARFDAVDHATLSSPKLVYRGDRIVSAFSDKWIEPGSSPPEPASASWLAVAADGISYFLVAFERIDGRGDGSPATVKMRIKAMN